jgi:transketolase
MAGPDDDDLATAVRFLAADMVDAARSGHPGLPLGMADVSTVLFHRHLRYDAADPEWFDRDRFVLSAGHGSALLYALAWLTGYAGVELDHLRRFRQLGSPAAGHPERGHFPGVETTTGPLGQGLAAAVGLAVAEARLRERHGTDLCNHRTWVLAGDGCLMEGISHEAIELAGHLRLDRLTVLWDDNGISIDGPTALAVPGGQQARFAAAGWHTLAVDGHDHDQIDRALTEAGRSDRPTLIACRTTIGRGAPNVAGGHEVHGKPLGAEERAAMAEALGWGHPPFSVPDEIVAAWRIAGSRGGPHRRAWLRRLGTGSGAELGEVLDQPVPDQVPDHLDHWAGQIAAGTDGGGSGGPHRAGDQGGTGSSGHLSPGEANRARAEATRVTSRRVLERLTVEVPALLGGAADLSGSCGTRVADHHPFSADDRTGTYLHYGVREHAMAAAMNGLALHGGIVPYGGTFLVFSDYSRPALRLAAMMRAGVIHVFTHDSIGVGEDGPTHQPVEHLDALRVMPGLDVVRPADAAETVAAWSVALRNRQRPTALVLSRQALPALDRDAPEAVAGGVADGGYLLHPVDNPAVVVLASGSEVAVAAAARDLLASDGIPAAVVSVPSLDRFARLDPDHQRRVLGHAPRVVVEAGIGQSWDRLLRPGDRFVGMTGFGASAPGPELYRHFGITPEAVRSVATEIALSPPSGPLPSPGARSLPDPTGEPALHPTVHPITDQETH